MAHLPPKIPNMVSPTNWPDFNYKKVPSTGELSPTTAQNPSWVDEFLDFSSMRRSNHRRTVSDPVTTVLKDQTDGGTSNYHEQLDNFDDEQFLSSMFTDEILPDLGPTLSSSNMSTPSDHNSINDRRDFDDNIDHKVHYGSHHEPDEVQSFDHQNMSDHAGAQETTNNHENGKIVDPKRVKRILANRQSAKRSRVRKLQYISELEKNVTTLQAEISALSPRVAFLDQQRLLLNIDNCALKQRIAALTQDKIFKDAHQEALKRDIERLRQVYQKQNLMTIDNSAPISSSDANGCAADANNGNQLLAA